ncbi:hypothetical protein FRUB_08179 [Fimbriiglobus ruber]|uniref:Uncharacterized protein n=1 Tax=Fimbriiglobus ruber TaxID=1908690 RepID=A0A225DE44_9BACT|nr:hypothetical protein FRUB_08179 [Fimbriiglobus ruber]
MGKNGAGWVGNPNPKPLGCGCWNPVLKGFGFIVVTRSLCASLIY